MKIIVKSLLVVVLFGLCFVACMTFAYDYLYEYPNGVLDTAERNVEARYYKLVYKGKIDSDTIIFFTRANNGVGSVAHIGTIDSNLPDMLANFKCEITSEAYLETYKGVMLTANSTDRTNYMAGFITDENTVSMQIVFHISDDENKVFDCTYNNQCWYIKDFDTKYAEYYYTIYGYNQDDGITFMYDQEPLNMTPAKTSPASSSNTPND